MKLGPRYREETQLASPYRAPATMAFFAVSLVLWLLASSDAELFEGQVLQSFLASHLFHASGWHLSVDLLIILVTGCVLETRWGALRFVAFYLLCAWGSTAVSLVFAELLYPVGRTICGASGVALGSLAVVGFLYPEHRVVRSAPALKHFSWVLILLVGALLVALPNTAGDGERALLLPQVSGVVFGLVFLRLQPWIRRVRKRWETRRTLARNRKVAELRARVDQLLQKISAEGAQSLTPEEKAFLSRASKHYRQDSP